MATVNLGRIKPVFKGAFANGTAYVVDDIVTSGNETFICIQASTGNATSNATYWTKLASKGADGSNGSNGTDLSTTLTTQGDILYRDGSGLQRLAKGTANQELRINSGATAPEWHTPAVASSDFVKVASGTHSGDYLYIDNIFSSSYPLYKVFIYNYSAGNYARMGLRTASGNYSTSDYRYRTRYWHRSASSTGDTGEDGWNQSTYRMGYDGSSGDGHAWEINIPDPNATDRVFSMFGMRSQVSGGNAGFAHFGGYNNSTSSTAVTGIRWYAEGSGSFTCDYAVYGMKI